MYAYSVRDGTVTELLKPSGCFDGTNDVPCDSVSAVMACSAQLCGDQGKNLCVGCWLFVAFDWLMRAAGGGMLRAWSLRCGHGRWPEPNLHLRLRLWMFAVESDCTSLLRAAGSPLHTALVQPSSSDVKTIASACRQQQKNHRHQPPRSASHLAPSPSS